MAAKKAVKKSVKSKPAAKPKAPIKAKKAPSAPPAPIGRQLPQQPQLVTKAPAGKPYSKQELAYFKTIIVEKRKEILQELETLRDTIVDNQTGEYVSENSTYSTHMEQGTDAMEREKMFLFASREGKFLNHLDDALKRIEKGDYGRCTECGKLIEKERLEAVPHAQQCLQCKMRKSK
ncbi:MAG TPA: TraR/DksA C4-type zinc finger protein [Bacteroidota bacterium]|nr:TraR/DksA C4-type zinc finger protein [Bacteroidota bacterium]